MCTDRLVFTHSTSGKMYKALGPLVASGIWATGGQVKEKLHGRSFVYFLTT